MSNLTTCVQICDHNNSNQATVNLGTWKQTLLCFHLLAKNYEPTGETLTDGVQQNL